MTDNLAQSSLDALVAQFHQGRFDEVEKQAQDFIEQYPAEAAGWTLLGAARFQLGQWAQAEHAQRRSVELAPQDPYARNNLALTLKNQNRLHDAAEQYRLALKQAPLDPDLNANLGVTLQALGKLDEAEQHLGIALAQRPEHLDAMLNLGNLHLARRRFEDASALYEAVLARAPGHLLAANNLAVVLQEQGDTDKALALIGQVLAANPQYADAHLNLGVVHLKRGELQAAEESLRRSLLLAPRLLKALLNLGHCQVRLKAFSEAERSYRTALAIDPNFVDAKVGLANLASEQGMPIQAQQLLLACVQDFSNHRELNGVLGGAYLMAGEPERAEHYLSRAVQIDPTSIDGSHNLLFVGHYMPGRAALTQRAMAEEIARKYPTSRSFSARKFHGRPIKVGLVSGDLRDHPVGYFLESFLRHLDLNEISLAAYSTTNNYSAMTERLRPHFAMWRQVEHLKDKAAAEIIASDGIDILFDLSGYTGSNRIGIFAHRPAAVQAEWLGYFATSGLQAIDYIVGDPYVTPTEDDYQYCETVYRLPKSYFCFSPPSSIVTVKPTPSSLGQPLTFGSFNNFAKINLEVIELWSRVLSAVPHARLLLKTKQLNEPAMQEEVRRRFKGFGIDPSRLALEPGVPREQLLAAYNRVDITLDPFPYPGGTTSIESIWMGRPVISLKGDRFLSRVPQMIAANLGLQDWVALDKDQYVQLATTRAADITGLALLSQELRSRLEQSALMDGRSFARAFETMVAHMCQAEARPTH